MTQVPDEPFTEALLGQTNWLRGLVRSLIEDAARADDVCQATLLQAWQHRPETSRSLRPWLAQVARNLTRRLRLRESQRAVREACAAKSEPAPSAAETVERFGWQQAVVGLVMELDEPYRSTILVRFWEDVPPREVARRMGVPVETVRTRIRRGLATLRDRLDRRSGEHGDWVTALLPLAQPQGPLVPWTGVVLVSKKLAAVVAILLAGLALGIWFVNGAPPAQPPRLGENAPVTERVAATVPTPAPDPLERSAVNADARPAEGADPIDSDPLIAAAMCGFVGRILDPSGQPVERCDVRIHRGSFDSIAAAGAGILGGRSNGPGVRRRSTVTDSNGRFAIDGVWPRGIYVLVGDSPNAGRMLRLLDRTPAPGETVDLGDLMLAGSAVITGTVVDEDGAPVSGARVRATDLPAPLFAAGRLEYFDPAGALLVREAGPAIDPVIQVPAWLGAFYDELPIAEVRSDDAGRFRMVGVVPGDTTLIVDHPAWQPLTKSGVRVGDRTTQDVGTLRLRAGEEVVGTVVEASGVAIEGAEVLVAPTSNATVVDFATVVETTDAAGRFRCGRLPAGRVTIAARRAGGSRWTLVPPQSAVRDARVVLPEVGDLYLHITDGEGVAVDDPVIELMPGRISRQNITNRTVGLQAAVDLTERVTEAAAGTWLVRDLEAGPYVIAVAAEGCARIVQNAELPMSEPLELRLAAEQVHNVAVRDWRGEAIANAEVLAEPEGARDRSDSPLPRSQGRTDESGHVEVRVPAEDKIRILATHPMYGMADVVVAAATREVVVTLVQPGAIDGELLQDGMAPPVGYYSVTVQRQESEDQSVIARSPSIVAPGSDGRFVLEALQPGAYTLMAMPSTTAVGSLGGLVGLIGGLDRDSMRSTTVRVTAGGRAPARIVLGAAPPLANESSRLMGTVTLNGESHAGMRVQLRSGGDDVAVTRTDRGGSFATDLVAAGRYRLSISSPDDPDHPVYTTTVELLANATRHIAVQVATASVAGVTVDGAGQPMKRAFVDLMRASTDGPGLLFYRAWCNSSGEFEMSNLPAGTYRLRAMSNEPSAFAPVRVVDLVAGQPRTGLRFELRTAFEVRGTLDRSAHDLESAGAIALRIYRLDSISENAAVQALVARTSLSSAGDFAFNGLSDGTYRIAIETGDGRRLEHAEHLVVERESLRGVALDPVEER